MVVVKLVKFGNLLRNLLVILLMGNLLELVILSTMVKTILKSGPENGLGVLYLCVKDLVLNTKK